MYGEPISVTVQDGRPIRFIWRDRLHTVLVALEHWVVSREWWQRNNPDTDVPAEREFWRVEARPVGCVPAAVYELRRDSETGAWLLIRVWDLSRAKMRRRYRAGATHTHHAHASGKAPGRHIRQGTRQAQGRDREPIVTGGLAR